MNCMKCGKKTEDRQVFCAECLEIVEKHPVKRGTAVQIPNRPVPVDIRRQPYRKREAAPEEQVEMLRTLVRRLTIALVGMTVALLIAGNALLGGWLNPAEETAPPTDNDRNYSTSGSVNGQ